MAVARAHCLLLRKERRCTQRGYSIELRSYSNLGSERGGGGDDDGSHLKQGIINSNETGELSFRVRHLRIEIFCSFSVNYQILALNLANSYLEEFINCPIDIFRDTTSSFDQFKCPLRVCW